MPFSCVCSAAFTAPSSEHGFSVFPVLVTCVAVSLLLHVSAPAAPLELECNAVYLKCAVMPNSACCCSNLTLNQSFESNC